MSPRRSARADAAAELNTSALASLPLPLAQRVFLLLPVDSRARAACVCRAWRAVLADPALWTRLDVSDKSDIAAALDVDAVLRAASARAAGRLHTLSVDRTTVHVDAALLLQVLAANADSLRELHVGDWFAYVEEPQPALEALLRTAPRLLVLGAGVICAPELAMRLMRAESPFVPLRLTSLGITFTADSDRDGGPGGNNQVVARFAALLSDAALQPQLEGVGVSTKDLVEPIVADAIVSAALTRGLSSLSFSGFRPPAAEPLARLLSAGKLRHLLFNVARRGPLFDAASAAAVADALRVNTSLCSLKLIWADAFGGTSGGLAVLDALVGHPNLDTLMIIAERRTADRDTDAFAIALGALVAADAPALQKLTISCSALGDDGLRLLVDALPANRHLRELDCQGNNMSEEFARDHLLPAVRANTGLRALVANYSGLYLPSDRYLAPLPAAAEAEELVRRRTALQG